MRLSIVTTLYRSAGHIDEFYARMARAAGAITDDFEIVFVNDGSPDDSLGKAVAIHHADPRVVVVDLSRNFGHHRAMMAGLGAARGDLTFLIDSDLDEAPELVGPFLEAMRREACDVVYGVQRERRGGGISHLCGELFYRMINALGDEKIPRNVATVRLMTREYVRNLLRHREREMVISRLWAATGFSQRPFPFDKRVSSHASTYSLARRLRLVVDAVIAYGNAPLYLLFYTGLAIALLSAACLVFVLARFLTQPQSEPGWTTLIASVWMFGGLTLLTVSLIGIYVAHIHTETKRRPYVIVRRIYRSDAVEPEARNASHRA